MATWMLYAATVALLVGAAAGTLERTTRSHALASRWLWALALVASCVLPFAALLQPRPQLAPNVAEASFEMVAPAAPSDYVAAPPQLIPERSLVSSVTSSVAVLRARLPAPPRLPSALDPLARATWLVLSFAMAATLLRAHLVLERARRGWARQRIDGREVLVSDEVGPAVVGVLSPAIVMPRWAIDMSAEERELMLRHEEEHRRAGDVPLLLSAFLFVILLPWNLPLWWQLQRLRLAVEVDCDRRVLRRQPDLRLYATLLLEMGRRGSLSRLSALALAHPAPFLERRIRTMTTRGRPRYLRTIGSLLLAGVLVAAASGMERPELSEAAPAIQQPASRAVGRIAGRVTDAATGAPIQNVQIFLTDVSLGTLSRANGSYLITGVPAGTHEIQAVRIGFATVRQQITVEDDGTAEADFQIAPQSIGLDEIVIDATTRPQAASPVDSVGVFDSRLPFLTGRITGRVTDTRTGAPLGDVQVYVVGAGRGAISRQTGRYVIENVPPGSYQLRAERIGLTTVTHPVTVEAGGTLEVNFELTAQMISMPGMEFQLLPNVPLAPPATVARLSGKVTDENGAPIFQAQVYLVGARIGALTRRDGTYAIDSVPAGRYEVRAERIGYAADRRQITLSDGEALEVNFILQARGGRPAPEYLEQPGLTQRDGPTPDALPSFTVNPDTVRSPSPQDFTRGRVVGSVTDRATGMPLTDVQVYLVGANLGGISRLNGQFVLVDVPPGVYELRAVRRGLGTVSKMIVVGGGTVVTANLEMRGGSE